MSQSSFLLKIGRRAVETLVVSVLTLGIFFAISYAFAQEPTPVDCGSLTDETACGSAANCAWDATAVPPVCAAKPAPNIPAPEPSKNQVVQSEKPTQPNWEPDALSTFGLKFLIRGKEALSWSLNIKDSAFNNPAIHSSYFKVLAIVNSLFILGLLAIAAMWMFSLLIPRRYLRRVILVYAAAVVFVNFALPVNQLLIDGTNVLQKTLMMTDKGTVVISDIVQVPAAYKDAVGYEYETGDLRAASEKKIEIQTGNPAQPETIVGSFAPDTITSVAGSIGTSPANLQISAGKQNLTLNSDQTLTVKEDAPFHLYNEQRIYGALMVILTGAAYFMIALVLVLRIVILWALLILSPVLFLLAVFRSTRGWFVNWLSLYGRWLLIGPLTALGLAIVVGIWQSVGLPIESGYQGGEFMKGISNIAFQLPGETGPNTLSTTGEMMEYLIFLFMLYLPLFFSFALTRQKVLQGAAATVVERFKETGKATTAVTATTETKTETKKEETGGPGLMGNIKNFFNAQIGRITETAMPQRMMGMTEVSAPMPTAQNFRPENLALTSIRGLMGLLGENAESRHSREAVIEKLAAPDRISDPSEQGQVGAVRQEIESRALRGEPEAFLLMEEIRETSQTLQSETTVKEKTTERAVPQEIQPAKMEVEVKIKEQPQTAPKRFTETEEETDLEEGEEEKKDEQKKEDDNEKNPDDQNQNA